MGEPGLRNYNEDKCQGCAYIGDNGWPVICHAPPAATLLDRIWPTGRADAGGASDDGRLNRPVNQLVAGGYYRPATLEEKRSEEI